MSSRSEPSVNWAEVIDTVATALAERFLSAEGDPAWSQSLLAAVSGSTPAALHWRLQHEDAGHHAAEGDVEPVIYQNELPIRLLGHGVIDVAAQALGHLPGSQSGESHPRQADGHDSGRVTAMVAVAALSTLRLDLANQATTLPRVRQAGRVFGETCWIQALDSLAWRTGELSKLLGQTAADRRHMTWQRVTLEDRFLSEAVAAAVVAGAASASGLPPQYWMFPFHLFCGLAVSAARASLAAIERWLKVEFLPARGTAERMASVAVLIADEASTLWRGCGCKADIEASEVAYAPRGACRQADHDLRTWLPGQPRPGSRNGARYASTLWGWQRRWLGGSEITHPAADQHPGRLQLRSNDVAGSLLARRWLPVDRGFGGPVMLYDRILPEFCLHCASKVRLVSTTNADGRTIIERADCCARQQLVYRSEFTQREGRRVLKPKLGIIVSYPDEGNAGYTSTASLGPLWLCRRSGRYSLSGAYCPESACGPARGCALELVHHGWVLLPLSEAWADLKATSSGDDNQTLGALAASTVGVDDLRLLAELCSQLKPGQQYRFETPADVWALARGWGLTEMNGFMAIGKQRGLELLLRCKKIAQAQAEATGLDSNGLNSMPAAARNEKGTGPGSECSDQDH